LDEFDKSLYEMRKRVRFFLLYDNYLRKYQNKHRNFNIMTYYFTLHCIKRLTSFLMLYTSRI